MGLFNRYTTDLSGIESALWEDNNKYCNPKDYFVTEEECRKYIEELKISQELNREWNEKRKTRWSWSIISLGLFFTYCVPSLLLISFDLQQYAWGVPIILLLSWIMAGGWLWLYNKTEDYFFHNETYLHKFFPPVNENIERLFDDYLWKEKQERKTWSKECQDKEKILQRLENMSHPEMGLFKQTIESELANPSDQYVFGDVEFGMTTEELFNTNVFRGLKTEDTKEIFWGYRGSWLGNCFGLGSVNYVSILYDNGHIIKVKLICAFGYEYKADIIEPFIRCCRKLNQIYGNPRNLSVPYLKSQLELFPMDRADFVVGNKCITLSIGGKYRHYKLELEFYKLQVQNPSPTQTHYDFSEEWFEGMRSHYARYYSNPYPDDLPF